MTGDKITNIEQPNPAADNGLNLLSLRGEAIGESTTDGALAGSGKKQPVTGDGVVIASGSDADMDLGLNELVIVDESKATAIADTQNLFAQAIESKLVASVERNTFNAAVRLAEPGERVATLAHPEGEIAAEGQWVVERLDADGNLLVGTNGAERWMVSAQQLQLEFSVTPEVLDYGKGIATTALSTERARVLRVTSATQVMTPEGLVDVKPGDRVVNVDFDALNNKPGSIFRVMSAADVSREFSPADTQSAALMQRDGLIDSRLAAGIDVLDTKEAQDRYWNERVAETGVYEFLKTEGEYHAQQVTADKYPEGLFISTTDLKITFEKDVSLPDGGVIKAGEPMPAGFQLYKADGQWTIKIPGSEFNVGTDIVFSGGQHVLGTQLGADGKADSDTRVIMSRPTYDLDGNLLIDSYTTSLGELNTYYNPVQVEVSEGKIETLFQPGEGATVRLDPDSQTVRNMVPVSLDHPVSVLSYDGAILDHIGKDGKPYNAYLVQIPGGKGYYVIDAKDMYPLFRGVNAPAEVAREAFMSAFNEAQAKSSNPVAAGISVAKGETFVPSTPMLEYIKVAPVEARYLDRPIVWSDTYADKANPARIAMPGDLYIVEGAGFYVAPRSWANKNYHQDSSNPELWWKTRPFKAQVLGEAITIDNVTWNADDYVVVPFDENGNPDRKNQYYVSKDRFERINATAEAFNLTLAAGDRPQTIEQMARAEATFRAMRAANEELSFAPEKPVVLPDALTEDRTLTADEVTRRVEELRRSQSLRRGGAVAGKLGGMVMFADMVNALVEDQMGR